MLQAFLDDKGSIFCHRSSKSHLRSSEVSKRLLSTTFGQIEVGTQNGCQCACLIKTHRLIYGMTYPDQKVTLTLT